MFIIATENDKQEQLTRYLTNIKENPEKDKLLALIYVQKDLLSQLVKYNSTTNVNYQFILNMYNSFYIEQQNSLAKNLSTTSFSPRLRETLQNFFLPNLVRPTPVLNDEKQNEVGSPSILFPKARRSIFTAFFQPLQPSTQSIIPQTYPRVNSLSISTADSIGSRQSNPSAPLKRKLESNNIPSRSNMMDRDGKRLKPNETISGTFPTQKTQNLQQNISERLQNIQQSLDEMRTSDAEEREVHVFSFNHKY